MNLLEKLYILIFTRTADIIVFQDGHFEIKLPLGYRYKRNSGIYQIFDPDKKGFLFQLQGFVLPDRTENYFDIENELKNEKIKNPNAEIQYTGIYDCICSSTVTVSEDKQDVIYTWKTGDRNKRILVTLLLLNCQNRKEIDEQINLAGRFMETLKIYHISA